MLKYRDWKQGWHLILLAALWLLAGGSVFAQSAGGVPIEITADGENRFEAGMAYASGNVEVHYGEDTLYADEITYDKKQQEVTATGNVRLYSGDKIYRGDQIVYNFDTRKIISQDFHLATRRIFAAGTSISTPENGKYVAQDAFFTAENREKPSYRVHAKTIEIYPDDRVVLKDAVFYVGNIPFMWVPYYSYSLKESTTMYELLAGSNERWGFYALNAIKWQINQQWEIKPHFDYRTKRGFGGGVDLTYRPKEGRKSLFQSYYIDDQGNDINVGGQLRPIEPPEERYRASYKQSSDTFDNVHVIADINLWSDPYITQDFFPDEFEKERIPDNVVEVMYMNENFTASALGRAQLNDLFEVSERKPEIKLEIKRQQIPYTPLSYEGESSVVSFQKRFDRDDPYHSDEYHSMRYDTFHQVLYPRQYFGWLSLTPRAGLRGTVYEHNNNPDNSNPNAQIFRYVLNAGVESSFKISKTWSNVHHEKLGINGLRHVAEPFINYSYVLKPNKTPEDFRGFDNRLISTKLPPLNYPAYNSIDSIDGVNVIRHGVRNKLQTQRDGQNVDLIDWVVYADLDFEHIRGVPVDQLYPQIYNDVEFHPVPWLKLNIDSSTGLTRHSFNEFNAKLTWQPTRAVEFSLGNRYLSNVPVFDPDTGDRIFENSHLITVGSFYRINEDWKFSQDLAFEAADGTLQEQRYTIHRDFTSCDVSLSAAYRDNRDIQDEFMVYVGFTLKAFPEHSLTLKH